MMMIDRQLIGDIVLAGLLALSSAAIAQPDAFVRIPQHKPVASVRNAVVALASAGDRQVGLYR